MKQRTDQTIDILRVNKEKERHNLVVCNDLARKYRTKADELELKHQELSQLHTEFEQKLHVKEVEENRLKKELGEIAMTLHLEAEKAKTQKHDIEQYAFKY